MTHNPWATALWVGAGLSLVIAFMLTVVTWQLTDYSTYDAAGVASIEGWVRLLVGVAAVTTTGAVVLNGIEGMLRRRDAVAVDAPPTGLERNAR
jgi:hypothetical protein